ncbi:MAG: hypothetical protein AAGI25_11660 [Bacteroidota bacterium]
MEINKELLRRYADGECTNAEKKRVEDWLSERDVISGEFDELEIQREFNVRWTAIESLMERDGGAKVIPLYKKLTRYAAVVCITVAIFVAGRYSTTPEINELVSQESTIEEQVLVIYGGDGGYGKIPGDSFKLSFDGQLKLYNASNNIKTISVGQMTYILQPKKTYYLYGNVESSSMIAGYNDIERPIQPRDLIGHFGITINRS